MRRHWGKVNKDDPANIDNADICLICHDARKDYVLLPCGHTTCQQCALKIKTSAQPCPFCRTELSGINKLFL